FNFAFGLVDYCEGYLPTGYMFSGNWCSGTNPAWWEDLVYTPQFANAVNCRWEELRATVWHKDSIKDFIAANRILLSNAASRNHARWPLMGQNPTAVKYVAATFNGDVALMENWLMYRIDWLDANMIGNDCNLSLEEQAPLNVHIFPNPTSGNLNVSCSEGIDQINIYTLNGTLLSSNEFVSGTSQVNLDLNLLSNGLFVCEIWSNGTQLFKRLAVAK
ncbi:MAG: T9SS type A sorting domain-containing protein, partial [Schleiferiaceae bacterium]